MKVIPDLVFRKAIDNFFLHEWVQEMSVLMNKAECSSLSWRVTAESKRKIEPSAATGTPGASCLLFRGTYLDAARELRAKPRETL